MQIQSVATFDPTQPDPVENFYLEGLTQADFHGLIYSVLLLSQVYYLPITSVSYDQIGVEFLL